MSELQDMTRYQRSLWIAQIEAFLWFNCGAKPEYTEKSTFPIWLPQTISRTDSGKRARVAVVTGQSLNH